jgi:hypothetical protein
MPPWLLTDMSITGRILAFAVGCICFYFAFFLYENEEGVWQNRIENLWISVYDRAKVTNSTSAALLNRVGEILKRVYIHLFGERLLSFQSIAVSMNLSLAGLTFCEGVLTITRPDTFYIRIVAWAALVATVVLVICAVLPAFFRTKWAVVISWLSWLAFLVAFMETIEHQMRLVPTFFYFMTSEILIVSLICDLVAVIILRKLFARLATNLSISRMIFMILAVCVLVVAIVSSILIVPATLSDMAWPNDEGRLASFLLMMNVPTLLSCVLPLLMLIVIFIHRLIWPLLSRILYPLTRHKIVTNRKVLIPVGTLCLTFAFNIEHVGLKEILKMFS